MNFQQVRYRYDDPLIVGVRIADGLLPVGTQRSKTRLLADAVKVTPALFPGLASGLQGIGESMRLQAELDCFVSADHSMQAYCVPHRLGQIEFLSVVLSSALVERLRPEEVRFVIGHEVGHFLCEHWRYPSGDTAESLGDRLAALRLSRSAEISADRIGMLASGSVDHACGAMIKVAAGLGAPHLQPDVRSVLSQFRELSDNEGDAESIWATHPIIPLRIRALLRFEAICRDLRSGGDLDLRVLQDLDEAIERDFHKASGHAMEKLNDQRLESVRVWGLLYLFCADGVISKAEQELLRETVGPKVSDKVLRFLKSQGGSPAAAVSAKLEAACEDAQMADQRSRSSLISEFEMLIRDAGLFDGPIQESMTVLQRMLIQA